MQDTKPSKGWIFLIICHVAAAILFFSWYSSQELTTRGDDTFLQYNGQSFWQNIDTAVFHSLNGSLKDSKSSQTFWAIANNRMFDLVSAFLMIGIYSIYVLKGSPEEKLKRIKGGLYMSISMIFGILLFKLLFTFERYSPTKLPLEGALKLSEFDHITWDLKDSSKKSFPGDHSTVLFMIAIFISYYARRWYGVAAIIVAGLFVLPRMVGGGHWFTDIIVGGGTIALITCSWALCTPIQAKIMTYLNKPGLLIMKICGKIIPSLKPPETVVEAECQSSASE